VSTLSKVSGLLADNMEVGDPPAAVNLGKMTMDVRKEVESDVVNKPVSSHIGSRNIIGQLDVPTGACVLSEVCVCEFW